MSSLNRRTAREVVMIALYAIEMSDDSIEHMLDTVVHKRLAKDEKLQDFAEKLFLRSVRDRKELDGIIGGFVKNWDVKRIATIDRCVMRMALSEMMGWDDIPTKVTINEAIEIVKKFSTANSGKFVNGILDAASKKLKEDGKITKSGTGLIEESIPKN